MSRNGCFSLQILLVSGKMQARERRKPRDRATTATMYQDSGARSTAHGIGVQCPDVTQTNQDKLDLRGTPQADHLIGTARCEDTDWFACELILYRRPAEVCDISSMRVVDNFK
jgi:hypothetical protein